MIGDAQTIGELTRELVRDEPFQRLVSMCGTALMLMRRTDGSVMREWARDELFHGDADRTLRWALRMDNLRGWGLVRGDSDLWHEPSTAWQLTEEGERVADMLWELRAYIDTVEPRGVLS